MSLLKLVEVEKGRLKFRVFRLQSEAVFFGAVDEERDETVIRSPLMTVSDVRCLLDLLDGQRGVFFARSRTLSLGSRLSVEEKAEEGNGPSITVIPSLPEYRYLHTCEACGCHVASHLRLSGDSPVSVCANCGHTRSRESINRTQLTQSSIDELRR